MKPKSIKVVVIDPFKKEIYERYMDGSLESIYKLIGNRCELFEVVQVDGFTDLYVDEEGLLEDHAIDEVDDLKKGFLMKGWNAPIFGRALVVGHQKGESVSTRLTDRGVQNMLTHWVAYNEKR